MTRSRADVREWALAYIEAQESSKDVGLDHPLWWSIERSLATDSSDGAEDLWALVLEVLSRSKSKRVLGMLASGPMEDLLDRWGEQFIDRIEATARRDISFRRMLRGVWESGTPEVWTRFLAAQEQGVGDDGP